MKWLKEESEFRELFAKAQELILIDSGCKPAQLQRFTFDDAELCTPRFLRLLQSLIDLSGDSRAYFLVLSPDPVQYFHRHFNKYPLLEIGCRDSADDYLTFLNEDPAGSPADAVGTNWSVSAIFPPGGRWFSHLLRSASDDGGRLWIPGEWVDEIIEAHSYLRAAPCATHRTPAG